MKVKNIKIEIKELKSVLEEAEKAMEDIEEGKNLNPKKSTSFSNIESFRKFFTPKRMQLLKTVKERKPKSIYKLSKILDRDIKSVSNDLDILEEHGLLELEKTKKNNIKRVKPTVNYDRIRVEVEI